MNTVRTGRSSGQEGMALAVALVTLMILVVMGLALGSVGIDNLNQIRQTGDTSALVHAANGGLHELMDQIYGDGSSTNGQYGHGVSDASADGAGIYTTSLKACHYWWTFNTSAGEPYSTNNLNGNSAVTGWNGMTVPARMALLVTSADEVPRAESQNPVRVVALVTNGYPYAITSDGQIEINNVTGPVPGQANVRSNSILGFLFKPNIKANSVDGMLFSRNGPGTIKVSDSSGPQLFDQDPISIPDLPILQVVRSQSTAGVSGDHPYGGPAAIQIPGSGSHDMSNDGSGNLVIDGVVLSPRPVSVYVNGNLSVSGGGSITIPKGVHLFVQGNMVVSGSLNQDTDPPPSSGLSTSELPTDENFLFVTGDLRFNGAQGQGLHMLTGGNIRQNGTSDFAGMVYSQNGNIQFNGGGTVTGAIIAKSGVSTLVGDVNAKNFNVVFDPSVFDSLTWLNFSMRGPVRTTSWQIQQVR
jgi:hypothetical protein